MENPLLNRKDCQMNKLIIKGSVLQNYEVIKDFKEQNELTQSELYIKSNLSSNQLEAFYAIYKCLKSEELEKFALITHE